MRFANLLSSVALVLCAANVLYAAERVPPRHDFPRVGTYEVLCGDFHMHAANSNLPVTTRERVEESFRLGYDVIAVTDHGTSRGYRVAELVGRELGMIVLNGMETGLDGTEHLGVIGMSSSYDKTSRKRWAATARKDSVYYQDEMRKILDHGGIIIYNHPNIEYEPAVEWGVKNGLITGIEVKNDKVTSKKTSDFQGSRCFPGAFDYALKHNLAIFADTDVHAWRIENPAKTLVFVRVRSPDGVMEAMRARRTAAWFDGMLWGREELISDLIRSCIALRETTNGRLVMTNLGPLGLKGRTDRPGAEFEIGPYGQATITAGQSRVLSVTWTNVWTSPRTNLKTELPTDLPRR